MTDTGRVTTPDERGPKRSVFRTEVLQREIERRDVPVPLKTVVRFSALSITVWGCCLMLAIGVLLALPITVTEAMALRIVPSTGGFGGKVSFKLKTRDSALIQQGQWLIIDGGGVDSAVRLRITRVMNASDGSDLQTGEGLIRTNTQPPASSFTLPQALQLGTPQQVSIRMPFLQLIGALAKARHE